MRDFNTGQYVSLGLLFVALLILLFPIGTRSLPRDRGDGPEPAICEPETSLQVRLSSKGLPLVGSEVQLSALGSKIVVAEPIPDAPASCEARFLSLATFGSTQWSLEAQPGTSSLTDVSTLGATLPLDRDGRYRVRFTACPDGCEAPLSAGRSIPVTSRSRVIDIDARDGIPVQPETEPVLPEELTETDPSTFPDAAKKCEAAASVINPAWVTKDEWKGGDDYQLLEGRVIKSHISRKDSPLNHDSQDFNIEVVPDPPYQFLRTVGDNVEVEWERDHFPEQFRPTRGDRVSVVGYWIHDCSHENKTELHPPALVAVHRPRAVEIPENQGFGRNIRVPGIVTHIWVNRDAGETTGNCSLTGLHQPRGGAGFDFGPHSCLPQTEGFDASPINRIYDFNIYLPEDPRQVLGEVAPDLSPPPVPIYTEPFVLGGDDGAELNVDVDPELGSFVRVRLDLTDYRGRSYAARVHSAWALPSPDNWDLHRWRVQVEAVDVHGDADFGHDGEWRLWVNTNSTDQEWTMVLDQSLDEGRKTFDGLPFSTGNANPRRALGSDLLLFPRQRIWVHSSGFEDDALWSDNTGHVYDLKQQRADRYRAKSRCNESGSSGCGSYTLDYQVQDRGRFGAATLTPEGRALFDAYTIRLSQAPGAVRYPGVALREFHHPSELILTEENPEVRLSETDLLAFQGVEPFSIGDIGAEEWSGAISQLEERGPERLDEFLADLRGELAGMFERSGREDLQESFAVLKDNLPSNLWERHFEDLAEQVEAPPGLPPLLLVLILVLVATVALLLLVLLRRIASS